MFQESRACIITNYSDMKKKMKENKQSKELKNQIMKSIANLDSDRMKKIIKVNESKLYFLF